MSRGLSEPTLVDVWRATVADAREQLAAVERGDLRASARQVEMWSHIVDRARSWGLA